MKNGILNAVLILLVVLFTSCHRDDDSVQTEDLNGIWNIKNISGGIAGIDDDYENGKIIWTFNSQKLTLNVENNTIQENSYSGFESGTYTYAITESGGNNYILINNDSYGSYILKIDALTIIQNDTPSGTGADGFILQLER